MAAAQHVARPSSGLRRRRLCRMRSLPLLCLCLALPPLAAHRSQSVLICLLIAVDSPAVGAPIGSDSVIAEMPDVDDDASSDDEQYGTHYDEDDSFGGSFYYEYGDVQPSEEMFSQLFAKLDTDHDGKLSSKEIHRGLKQQAEGFVRVAMEQSADEAASIVADADQDGDGRLSPEELESADMMYLHHDGAVDRKVLFEFADKGRDGSEEPDGYLDVGEVAALVFPEWSPRADELRHFLSKHTLESLDKNSDGLLDKRELFHFHAKRVGLPTDLPEQLLEMQARAHEAQAADEHAGGTDGQLHHRRAGFASDFDDEPDGGAWDDSGMHEAEYATHNETFDWHDSNGDGLLDAAELGAYLLPESHGMHLGYVEDETSRLVGMLRDAGSLLGGEGEHLAHEGGEDEFSLEHIIGTGQGFLDAFETFMEDLGDEEGVEGEDRGL